MEKVLEFSNRDLKKLIIPLIIEQTLVITVGMAGLEPTKCQSQSLVPYRLGYIPILTKKNGVNYGSRTHDLQGHNLAL